MYESPFVENLYSGSKVGPMGSFQINAHTAANLVGVVNAAVWSNAVAVVIAVLVLSEPPKEE